MLIIGAKGFAKEVLEILHQNKETENLCFYDDVNSDNPEKLYNLFPILENMEEAKEYFNTVSRFFILGIGNPKYRKMLYDKFVEIGGEPYSIISKNAEIGSFENNIDEGVIITSGVVITNSITIKKGTLINLSSTIGHDSLIGEFVEICPNVSVSGHCEIGDGVFIGTGAIVLPGVKIGKNSIVAAGSVVRTNVPDNVMVAGAPAEIKRHF
ncbi:MAG: acetyltransferase [Weeksellaceae bacterium]